MAQPCHPGPRLFETDRDAYEAQARRVFAAHRIPYAEHRYYELDHRVPRCLAVRDHNRRPHSESVHRGCRSPVPAGMISGTTLNGSFYELFTHQT
jgi:hypothetical protein